MLPSDMNLKIKTGTVRYNNKILVFDGNFSLGKNDEVNLTVPAIKSYKTNSLAQKPNFSYNEKQEPQPITHNDEKVAHILFLTGGFGIFLMNSSLRCFQNLMRLLMFDELVITILRTAVSKISCDT